MTETLEEKTVSREKFFSVLKKYNFASSFGGYHGADSVCQVYTVSSANTVFSSFKIKNAKYDPKSEDICDIRIHNGSAHDIDYLQQSSRLKQIFEKEKIPYTDERDITILKQKSRNYAESLLRAALEL